MHHKREADDTTIQNTYNDVKNDRLRLNKGTHTVRPLGLGGNSKLGNRERDDTDIIAHSRT